MGRSRPFNRSKGGDISSGLQTHRITPFLSSFSLSLSQPSSPRIDPTCGKRRRFLVKQQLVVRDARMVDRLFEDIFQILRLNPDGKKFDKVTRIEAKSETCEMFMHLDVNSEVYPMREGEKFSMALTSTINLDGTPDTGYFTQGNRKTLADEYEYVMQGKLFKISEGSKRDPKAEVNASFGGLLMMLKGEAAQFKNFELDQRMFLLIRKL